MRVAVLPEVTIVLPRHYRVSDFLSFHQRDPEGMAEQVTGSVLRKGLLWQGQAACLTVAFRPRDANVTLAVDGAYGDDEEALTVLASRMLGLTQGVGEFEGRFLDHPVIGPLIWRHRGLRVPLLPTAFEALTWAVTGQQISLRAAIAVRRRLIRRAGKIHSSGLWCYPDAEGLARLDVPALRALGYSQSKARTLIDLSRAVTGGALPLAEWEADLPVEAIRKQLSAVRGIGPWTVDYALLRGFGWLDGSLHGDVAVRRHLQALLAFPEKPSPAYTRDWLAGFSPWRALVAAHLWAG